jgi:hypothetical protein
MAEEDQQKTAFVTEWGVFAVVVMMFGLWIAPATFQWIIMEVFEEYIPSFMQVFLDNFAVFVTRKVHLQHVELCRKKCREARLSLNLAKCAFEVTSGLILGHSVSKDRIAMDADKVKAVLEAPAPQNAKALSRFLGHIRWHSRMIHHLADFATPLHAAIHKKPFTWTEEEEKAFTTLKILFHVDWEWEFHVDWEWEFHVFVDASDMAIDNILMQMYEKNKFQPMYCISR